MATVLFTPTSGTAHAKSGSVGPHLALVQLAEAQGYLRCKAAAASFPLDALLPNMECIMQIPSLRFAETC